MRIAPDQIQSRMHPVTVAGKILDFPLSRLVVCILFFVPYLALHNIVIAELIPSAEPWKFILTQIDRSISAVVFFLIYYYYVKWVERRPALEISPQGSFPEFILGTFLSFVIIGIIFIVMIVTGFYRINDINFPVTLLDALFTFTFGALIQVIFFRLIVFRLAESVLGSYLAIPFSAVIFGGVHMINGNATFWSTAALMLSDVLLCAAFIYSHRIWLVWGIHAAWNFLQDGVLGMPNSGIDTFPSWLSPAVSGPSWLTGGDFGIEASVLTVTLNVIAGIVILWLAARRNQILPSVCSRTS